MHEKEKKKIRKNLPWQTLQKDIMMGALEWIIGVSVSTGRRAMRCEWLQCFSSSISVWWTAL
jgi:hypothetical protein